MRAHYLIRVRFLIGCIALVAAVIIGKLYMLQIVHGASYASQAERQYVRSSPDLFDRGTVYFTERTGKQIAAASTKIGYRVAIDPTQLSDPEDTYRKLKDIIPLEREVFMQHARKEDDPYEEIAQQVDQDAANALKALHIRGVQLFRDQWRYYPGDTLGAHVLGFVGYDSTGETERGMYGVERYWESVLKRNDDRMHVNFFAEVFANVQASARGTPDPARAGDIVTSIEPAVQSALERTLAATEEEWHAKQITGIIINPTNGDIYALASLPTFNPNSYADASNNTVFGNPAVEDVYEMGSIIKPIAMAIGLDEGAVKRTTTYDDTGRIKVNGYTISNYDGRARGVVDMQEVLKQSLNVGMAFVARQVGGPRLAERMLDLGFGDETGIDLPYEARGLVENLKSGSEVSSITAAFGQGIALTPIETVRTLSALGNGGYLITPHLVQEIKYTDGMTGNVSIDEKERVLTSETSEEITRMLVTVVDEALRGGTVKKEHYSIAAKTGTAQIARTDGRGYYDDRYLHSFFGYFPAYDPEFLIFLFHIDPQGAQYASETLTKPFMDLVDFLINYYEIPPDR